MNFDTYRNTWKGIRLENQFHRIVLLLLVTIVGGLSYAVVQQDRTVILVPPILEGQVNIARETASQSVKESWAMFVAELLGNVSADTADFVNKSLSPLIDAPLREQLRSAIGTQVAAIKKDRVSMVYRIDSLSFDEETETFFVTGQQEVQAPGAVSVKRLRTYELRITFRNYRPIITHLDAYTGQPGKRKDEVSESENDDA